MKKERCNIIKKMKCNKNETKFMGERKAKKGKYVNKIIAKK